MKERPTIRRKTAVLTVLLAVLGGALLIAPPTAGQDPGEGQFRDFIAMMNGYLTVADKWVDILDRPEAATFMALEGIVEIYEARGEKRAAIPHLQRLLEEHGDNLPVRNAIRFQLRDLYKELRMADEALAELDRIVAENAE